jgi:hypothetical protein
MSKGSSIILGIVRFDTDGQQPLCFMLIPKLMGLALLSCFHISTKLSLMFYLLLRLFLVSFSPNPF